MLLRCDVRTQLPARLRKTATRATMSIGAAMMDVNTKRTPPLAPSSVTVLVVDDDEDLRVALGDVLRLHGYTVFEAPDGMSALDRLRTHPNPLIVLLDWYLPSMDGLQVLQALAADESAVQPHIFIMLTAADYELRRRLSRDISAIPSHFSVTMLGRPFDLDDLLTLVARAAAYIAHDT
jgi:CheY-like chemotaxis protein